MKTTPQYMGSSEQSFTPIRGKEVWIRRFTEPNVIDKTGEWLKIMWHELRVYQTPNILQLLSGGS